MLNAGEVIAKFKADITDFKNGVEKVKTMTLGVNDQMMKLSKSVVAFTGVVGVGMLALGKSSVDASSEFQKSMLGLETVAKAFGMSAEDATRSAQELASDGLMSVRESAEGLKNLLATGFSLPEAINLMKAFKDSASFNRQGTLEFGQAIVGATQGIKNQNSIMVDNAGITKNLSNILIEAGKSANDLSLVTSDASVRQALYNGILKEASVFSGDAEKSAQTYAGQLSKLKTEVFNLKVSIGNELLPILTNWITWINTQGIPLLRDFITWVKDHKEVIIGVAVAIATLMVPAIVSWTVAMTALAVSVILASLPLIALATLVGVLAYVWVKNWDTIKENTKAVIEIITNYAKAFSMNISNFFTNIKNNITNAINTAWSFIKNTFQSGIDFVNNLMSGFVNTLKGIMTNVYNAIVGKIQEAWDKVKDIANKIRESIASAFDIKKRNSPSILDRLLDIKGSTEAILSSISIPAFSSDIASAVASVTPSISGITQSVEPAKQTIVNQTIYATLSDNLDISALSEQLAFKARNGL